jgi:hypothetical protein
MSTRSPDIPHAGPPVPACGAQLQPARGRLAWLGALPVLARPITRTMPWVTLIIGCLAGVIYLTLLATAADSAHWSLTQGYVRFAFVPAIAALAFVVRAPLRPLTQTTPVPVWVAPVGYLLLAAPVLAATCWAELRIVAHTIPDHADHAAVYPLLAQLTGWCVVTVAIAAWADRSRYADLGGVIAAVVSSAAIALAWYLPVTARFLVDPPATQQHVTIAWYAIATAGLALTCLAMRDHWHRYARRLRISPARAPARGLPSAAAGRRGARGAVRPRGTTPPAS